MKFSKNDFSDLDLPNLLINIWTYADHLHDPSVKSGVLSLQKKNGNQIIWILTTLLKC